MSTACKAEIELAIKILRLNQESIVRLRAQQAEQIIQVAKARFVEGNPRSWWLSLRVPCRIVGQDASSGVPSLIRHWASDESFCWFVPEVEDGSYPVYETTVPIVERILSECSFFEYYLLNRPLDRLLIENDHNQIVIAQYTEN
jgi:hypothetical protein